MNHNFVLPVSGDPQEAKVLGYLLALAGTVLAGLFVAPTLAEGISSFFDPCMQWGVAGSGVSIPTEACPTVRGTSETRLQALTRLAAVQGGTLLGVSLGVVGMVRSRAVLIAVGIGILFVESVLLGFGRFGPLMLLSALLFLVGVLASRKTMR